MYTHLPSLPARKKERNLPRYISRNLVIRANPRGERPILPRILRRLALLARAKARNNLEREKGGRERKLNSGRRHCFWHFTSSLSLPHVAEILTRIYDCRVLPHSLARRFYYPGVICTLSLSLARVFLASSQFRARESPDFPEFSRPRRSLTDWLG